MTSIAGTVKHLFIATDRGSPMLGLPEVEAVRDVGLQGDRYAQAANRKSADYQFTLIELENIEAFAQASGLRLAPDEPRRNVVTVGVRLNDLCGKRFTIGAVELEGLELCEPCGTFAKRTHPQVIRYFVHKGGLRCRIIRGGTIRIGDQVRPQSIHVSALSASDVSRYRELLLHAYSAAPDAFVATPEERAAEPESWWLRRAVDPTGTSVAFGAFHEGRLIGTATLEFSARPKTRHKALLIGMFVEESSRGLGAGAALVQAALAYARTRAEVQVITLTVTQGNAPAIGLYERCGFRAFGTEPMAIATREGYKAKVHMWLPIRESSAG